MLLKKSITVLLHFGVAFGCILLAHELFSSFYSWVIGLFLYLSLTFCVYRIIPKYHRKGIKHLSKGDYESAFQEFEKSFVFFSKYDFLDSYGFIFLLNMSNYSYRESALLNQAFIHYKVGKYNKARVLYETILNKNAKNRIAKITLKRMEKETTDSK